MDEIVDVNFFIELIFPATLGLFAFLIRFSVKQRKMRIGPFILDALSAVFIGLLVAFSVDGYVIPEKLKWAIVTLGSLLGPEILSGFFHISSMFSRSPVTFTLRIVRIIRGKPMTSKEIKEMVEWEKEFINEIKRDDDRER